MSMREFYDELYLARPDIWNDPDRDSFAWTSLEMYGVFPKTMLDIGCGNGHTIEYFRERWPGVKYTGLDLSETAIAIARDRVPEAEFVRGALGEAALESFDLVTVMGVAEHFEDLAAGLEAVRKAGGVIYLEVPNCLGYPGAGQEWGFRKASIGSGQPEWHFPHETWEALLEKAGMRILAPLNGPTLMSAFVWILEGGLCE